MGRVTCGFVVVARTSAPDEEVPMGFQVVREPKNRGMRQSGKCGDDFEDDESGFARAEQHRER